MPEQLNIDGGAETIRAAETPGRHEAVPLFDAPATMRGQLSAWAESVCAPAEIEADPRAAWALDVTERRSR